MKQYLLIINNYLASHSLKFVWNSKKFEYLEIAFSKFKKSYFYIVILMKISHFYSYFIDTKINHYNIDN